MQRERLFKVRGSEVRLTSDNVSEIVLGLDRDMACAIKPCSMTLSDLQGYFIHYKFFKCNLWHYDVTPDYCRRCAMRILKTT